MDNYDTVAKTPKTPNKLSKKHEAHQLLMKQHAQKARLKAFKSYCHASGVTHFLTH